MAENPFDKYVTEPQQPSAKENPFAKYAPRPPSELVGNTAPSTTKSTRQYSWGEVPGAALSNSVESGGRFFTGILNALMHPVDTISGMGDVLAGAAKYAAPSTAMGPATGVVNMLSGNKVSDLIRAASDKATDPQTSKRIEQAAQAFGDIYVEKYGNVDAIKRTLAEDPVGAVADISTLLTGGGAAAGRMGMTKTGAALSSAGTKTNPMHYPTKVIEVPFKMAAGGASMARNAFDPKSATYSRAVGDKGQEVLNALRAPSEIVPGSLPTAAEAAASVGATRFSAMGDSAARTLSAKYLEREQSNKAALRAAVQSVGKSPVEVKAAEQLRRDTAAQTYNGLDKTLVSVDDGFKSLMERPSMAKVVQRAEELAAEKGVPFSVGKDGGAPPAPSVILDASGQPIKNPASGGVQYPASTLHMMKMAFDDLTKNPERFGMGANEVAAIGATRAKFLNWFEDKVPNYKVARETFAKQSEPINQMQVGQFLEGKLTPALGEDSARLRAAGYASALEQAPSTIKKATGQSRYEHLSEIMTPEQIATLNAVRDDLARSKLAEYQASKARGEGPRVGLAGTAVMEDVRSPNFMSATVTLANTIVRRLQGAVDERLAIELATEMLDPKVAAVALEKALARDKRTKAVSGPLKEAGKAASATIRTPAATNALISNNEQQNALNQ